MRIYCAKAWWLPTHRPPKLTVSSCYAYKYRLYINKTALDCEFESKLSNNNTSADILTWRLPSDPESVTYLHNVRVGSALVGFVVLCVFQEDFVHVGAGVLEQLVGAVEDDEGDFTVAQNAQLIGLLHQSKLPLHEGHLERQKNLSRVSSCFHIYSCKESLEKTRLAPKSIIQIRLCSEERRERSSRKHQLDVCHCRRDLTRLLVEENF